MLDANTIAFLGILVGVVLRTALPFIKKIQEGEDIVFDKKYVYTALGSILGTYGILLGLLNANPMLAVNPIILGLIAFIFGYGDTEIINFTLGFIGLYTGKPVEVPPEEEEEIPA